MYFPSSTGYHRFDYPLYRPIEQSFIESITFRLVTKNGEDVLFDDSDIPSVVTLHFKNKFSQQKVSVYVTMDRYTRHNVNQCGSGEIRPVYRASIRVQMGNGIGSFFRGLFRFVIPLLYSGAKAVGKEALKTGSNIRYS